jgi:hypothetical protein
MLTHKKDLRNGNGLTWRVAIDAEREGTFGKSHHDLIALREPTLVNAPHFHNFSRIYHNVLICCHQTTCRYRYIGMAGLEQRTHDMRVNAPKRGHLESKPRYRLMGAYLRRGSFCISRTWPSHMSPSLFSHHTMPLLCARPNTRPSSRRLLLIAMARPWFFFITRRHHSFAA